MNTIVKTKLATLAAFAFVATAPAFYNAEMGRWLSRDPIGEQGGQNVYDFVGNQPLSRFDKLGLEAVSNTDCKECKVRSVRMEIFGAGFWNNGYSFNVVAYANYENGGKYDSSCCVLRRYIKYRLTVNFVPRRNPSSAPGDGEWHPDVAGYDWPGFDENNEDTYPVQFPRGTRDETSEVAYDEPGISGLSDGMTVFDESFFKAKIKDRCRKYRVVKTSNTVSYRLQGTWPDSIRYSISN